MGSFMLKNVEEPMEIFALANDGMVVPRQRGYARHDRSRKDKEKYPVKMGCFFITRDFVDHHFLHYTSV